ncbi:MAG: hypothetical protein IPM26_00640 [Saprospiraceae bacterium]|nr:hypothetical protein [Saprospiraceae bacterium]
MTDIFEKIDDYIQGKLTDSEKQVFEAEMEKDPLLKYAVENHSLTKDVALGFLEAEVRNILKYTENEPAKRKSTSWWKWWWMAAVFLLGLIAVVFYLGKAKKTTLQYADLYIEPAWPIQRSESSDTLSDAVKIALNGNTPAAVNMIRHTSIPDPDKNLWIAEIFARSGQADSTLHYLPDAGNEVRTRDRILYLRILSLFRNGQIHEMKAIIDSLPEDTDMTYKEIYKKIRG